MTNTGLELRVLFFVGRGNHKWSSQGNWKGSSSCSDKSQRDGTGWCSGFLPCWRRHWKCFWFFYFTISFFLLHSSELFQCCIPSNLCTSITGLWHGRATWNTHSEWSDNGARFYISGILLQLQFKPAYFSLSVSFFVSGCSNRRKLNVLCFQSKAIAVVVDFTDPSTVYDNVKQASSLNQR